MNRTLKVIAILGVVALIGLMGTVAVFAQSGTPAQVQDSAPPATDDTVVPAGNGYGQRRGPAAGQGLLAVDPDEMHAAIANALGISIAELEAAQADGNSLVAIAQDLGVDMTVVRDAMAAIREAALNQAVASGLLSADEAASLLSRPAFGQGAGRGYDGTGPGMARGGRGMGAGNGQGYGRMHTP